MTASAEPRERFGAEDCEAGIADASDNALGAEFVAFRAEIRAFQADLRAFRAQWARQIWILGLSLAALVIGGAGAAVAAAVFFMGGS